jgi:hypothetical protein
VRLVSVRSRGGGRTGAMWGEGSQGRELASKSDEGMMFVLISTRRYTRTRRVRLELPLLHLLLLYTPSPRRATRSLALALSLSLSLCLAPPCVPPVPLRRAAARHIHKYRLHDSPAARNETGLLYSAPSTLASRTAALSPPPAPSSPL